MSLKNSTPECQPQVNVDAGQPKDCGKKEKVGHDPQEFAKSNHSGRVANERQKIGGCNEEIAEHVTQNVRSNRPSMHRL